MPFLTEFNFDEPANLSIDQCYLVNSFDIIIPKPVSVKSLLNIGAGLGRTFDIEESTEDNREIRFSCYSDVGTPAYDIVGVFYAVEEFDKEIKELMDEIGVSDYKAVIKIGKLV